MSIRPRPGAGCRPYTGVASRAAKGEAKSCGESSLTMSGFKNFIMRGNLAQLAVAVVIGSQFSDLVKQFVQSFINPLLSLAGGNPDFGGLAPAMLRPFTGATERPQEHAPGQAAGVLLLRASP
jgi:Large-conductance mechanosensitive channel, MscL